MPQLEVITLGVGDSFSEKYHPASFLLCHGNFVLAIDCPDRFRALLKKVRDFSNRQIQLENIQHFLITHVHGDHMGGLEAVAFYKKFMDHEKTRLVASPEVRSVIWKDRLKASMGTLWDGKQINDLSFDDYFIYEALDHDVDTRIGPLTITTQKTKHHVPTSALLIKAGSRTLGYSSDTSFDRSLIDFLSVADLVIHETNYGPGHSSYQELVQLPKEIKNRMRLIHYPDDFDLSSSEIRPLNEGDIFSV